MFRRKRKAADFGAEIQTHIELETERLREQGMDEAAAQRDARRAFGNVTRAQERFYEAGRWLWWDDILRDLRLALRLLRKSPSFTLLAIATLALGIGANAVAFGALNAVLRPLDVPRAQGLYSLARRSDAPGGAPSQSYPDYLDLRDQNHSFDGLAAFGVDAAALDPGRNPFTAWVNEVSGNYFDLLGVQPYLGRMIQPGDERGANSAPYAVLSYACWHSRFQDDRSVVGHTIRLNRHPFTVLGVAPPAFHGTLLFFTTDVFVPIVEEPLIGGAANLSARSDRWVFEVIGHLKAGVTPAQATADLDAIGARLERSYPGEEGQHTLGLDRPGLHGNFIRRPAQAFVMALMLLAGLILLAACANLGGLFAAHAADRSREVAVRLALGSPRRRILRQLFVEALLLSLLGGALGLWGSVVLLRGLSAWRPFTEFPINLPVSPDVRVYLAALIMALASALLFGAVPVRQVLRTNPYEVIKSGVDTALAGRRIRVRDVLMAVQIALCALLVTASLVAVRGLGRSMTANVGFEPRHAMLASTDLRMAGYSAAATPAMQQRMIAAMGTIPGVTAAGLVGPFPPVYAGWDDEAVFNDQAADLRAAHAAATAVTYSISPGYFRAANTALLAGRGFTWRDDANSPRVAVVNRDFALKLFGSVPGALGRYFKQKDGSRWQVVGVAEDGKYTQNLAEPPQPAMFLPILQSPSSQSWLVVRSNADSQPLAAAIRGKLHELDPGLPAFIQTRQQEMSGALFAPRVAAVALGTLGLLGALLSITGIYGLAARSVNRRRRELGIRMALGAQACQVLHAAVGRASRLLAIGSAAGLVLGILASRVLAFIVYQATPRDPLVLAGVMLAMLLVGLLATWIPAQRALAVDPAALLREE